jgi:hypothetical protein
MTKHTFLAALIVAMVAFTSTAFSPTQAPVRNDNLLGIHFPIRTGANWTGCEAARLYLLTCRPSWSEIQDRGTAKWPCTWA